MGSYDTVMRVGKDQPARRLGRIARRGQYVESTEAHVVSGVGSGTRADGVDGEIAGRGGR